MADRTHKASRSPLFGLAALLGAAALMAGGCSKGVEEPAPAGSPPGQPAVSSPRPVASPVPSGTVGNPPAPSRPGTSGATPGSSRQVSTPLPGAQPTSAGSSSQATPPVTPGGQLTLVILEPQDGVALEVSTVTIRGRTSPEAVVTINGEDVDVDVNGNFSIAVTLEEGPNIFDVVATDEEGNEAATELSISYVP